MAKKSDAKKLPQEPSATTGVMGVVDAEGNLLKDRVPTVEGARALLLACLQADFFSRRVRVIAQAELDGAEPYDQMALIQTGQQYRTNVNFRAMKLAHEKALAALRDCLNNNPYFCSVRTTYGNPSMSHFYSERMSYEITKMIRNMPGYDSRLNYLLHCFGFHGFATAYFDDRDTWYWNAGGLDDFAFERDVKPDPSTLELVFATRDLRAHELYAYVRDQKNAEEAGWNVKAVLNVLKTRSYNVNNPWTVDTDIERMQKNHDITLEDMIGTTIPIVHMYVQEFDGTVTHSVFYRDTAQSSLQNEAGFTGGDFELNNEFLYKKKKAYESMEEAFIMFPYGTSTNGDIHALRGFGHDILPMAQSHSKLMCASVDIAQQNLSYTITPKNEAARVSQAVSPMGAYTVVDPNFDLNSPTPINIDASAGPVMAMLADSSRQHLGEIDITADAGNSKTQFQAEVMLGQATLISKNVLERLIRCFTSLMKEQVRRIVRMDVKDESVRGSSEVKRLRDDLVAQGIPIEAFEQIDVECTRAVPSLGSGSPVQRKILYQNAMGLMQFLPEKGQKNLVRLMLGNDFDPFVVSMLMPDPQATFNNANQEGVAIQQNYWLEEGREVPVLPEEDHRTHAAIHARYIMSLIPDMELTKEEMAQLAPAIQSLVAQLAAHMDYLAVRKEFIPEFKQWEELIKRCNEIITNGMRALEAMQREAQQTQMMEAEAGGQGQPLTEEQMKQMAFEAEQQRKQAAFEAEQQRKDRETNSKISRDAAATANESVTDLLG